MASRAELLQIAKELDVDVKGMKVTEMTEELKTWIDKKYNRKFLISPDDVSSTLLHFMVEEFDYHLVNRKGERHNYKGEKRNEDLF